MLWRLGVRRRPEDMPGRTNQQVGSLPASCRMQSGRTCIALRGGGLSANSSAKQATQSFPRATGASSRMTIVVTVKINDGIVFASDSATTFSDQQGASLTPSLDARRHYSKRSIRIIHCADDDEVIQAAK